MKRLTAIAASASLALSWQIALPSPATAKSGKDEQQIHDICETMVNYRIYANYGQCIAEFNSSDAVSTCRHIKNTRGFGGLYKNFGECVRDVREHL